MVPDAQLVSQTRDVLGAFMQRVPFGARALAVIETAGGPGSPGPSGALQVRLGSGVGTPACVRMLRLSWLCPQLDYPALPMQRTHCWPVRSRCCRPDGSL